MTPDPRPAAPLQPNTSTCGDQPAYQPDHASMRHARRSGLGDQPIGTRVSASRIPARGRGGRTPPHPPSRIRTPITLGAASTCPLDKAPYISAGWLGSLYDATPPRWLRDACGRRPWDFWVMRHASTGPGFGRAPDRWHGRSGMWRATDRSCWYPSYPHRHGEEPSRRAPTHTIVVSARRWRASTALATRVRWHSPATPRTLSS